MRLKSELYKKEQEEIIDKIITILYLENKTEYTLYELDKNEEIQKQIMELIPEIRKYYILHYNPNAPRRPNLALASLLKLGGTKDTSTRFIRAQRAPRAPNLAPLLAN